MADLVAPADPRSAWPMPAFGTMPVDDDVDDLTTRVIAPNASHMTLDGTNTYVLAVPGSGAAVVVDPGPADEGHFERVQHALRRRDLGCEWILVTHHHIDHVEAAHAWAERFGAVVAAPTREVAGENGRVVGEGDRIEVGGLAIDAVSTPGHCYDHTAYRLPNGVLLVGDHVLGRGTAVVAWPDGDLAAYIESLHRVLALGPDALYPGHGPALTEDPSAVVQYYLDHRAFRERQVVAQLEAGVNDASEMVKVIYADVDERLWPAAELSTKAALAKLVSEGRANPALIFPDER